MKTPGKGGSGKKRELLGRIARECMDLGDPEDQKAVNRAWQTYWESAKPLVDLGLSEKVSDSCGSHGRLTGLPGCG